VSGMGFLFFSRGSRKANRFQSPAFYAFGGNEANEGGAVPQTAPLWEYSLKLPLLAWASAGNGICRAGREAGLDPLRRAEAAGRDILARPRRRRGREKIIGIHR